MKNSRETYLLLSLIFLTFGCSRKDYNASMDAKYASSALEAEMEQLNSKPISGPYAFSRNFKGSKYDTLAFPISARESKYFIIIANAKKDDEILKAWKEDEPRLKISRATLEELVQKGYVSEPVRRYLSSHVTG